MSIKNENQGGSAASAGSGDQLDERLQQGMALESAGKFAEAGNIYYQIVIQDPSNMFAMFRLATVCNKTGMFTQAEGFWERAVSADPKSFLARTGYGVCLYQLGKCEDAIRQYLMALQLHGSGNVQATDERRANIHQHIALAYGRLDKYEQMEEHLRAAINLVPGFAAVHSGLGYLRSLQGRSEEAKQHYRDAIQADPSCAEAYMGLAKEKKHTERDAEVKAMEVAFEPGRLSTSQRTLVAFALGKAYEDLGEYEKAFAFYKEGNDLHIEMAPYDIDAQIPLVNQFKKIYNASIEVNEVSDNKKFTPVFIVGMPRTGSSLLEQILISHSDTVGVGESNALSSACQSLVKDYPQGLLELGPVALRRIGQAYLSEISADLNDQHFVIDRSLNNYMLIGLIRMILPHAKIIHCRRDPMDICLSAYKNIFDPGALQYSYSLTDLGKVYRAYESVMSHWDSLFGEWIYEVDYEQLIDMPEAEVRRLFDFIGLPFEEQCLNYDEYGDIEKASSRLQVRKPIYRNSVNNWKNYEQELEPFRQVLNGN